MIKKIFLFVLICTIVVNLFPKSAVAIVTDTKLELYASDGTLLASNDDGGYSRNALISYEVEAFLRLRGGMKNETMELETNNPDGADLAYCYHLCYTHAVWIDKLLIRA